jgi:hypothetical protein
MNPKVGEFIAKTEQVVQGTTATPSQIRIRLFRQEIGGRTRLVRGKALRVRVANTGTFANSTNATIAGAHGSAALDTHTSNKDISFSEVQGIAQVETATVVAASGATEEGDLVVTVTSKLLAAPVVVEVPLTTSENTAAKVAAEIRTALGAEDAITDHFTVGGTSATVTLTAKEKAEDDATLNIAWPASIDGVAAVTSSANTTAGYAPAPGSFVVAVTDATAETIDLLVSGNTNADSVPIESLRIPITHAAP